MSDDVRTYLQFLQSTIARIEQNALYCKVLCCSVLAIITNIQAVGGLTFFVLSLFVCLICVFCDSLCLGVCRVYRHKYNKTVQKYYRKTHIENLSDAPEIYDMNPGSGYLSFKSIKSCCSSWSIKYPYGILFIIAIIISYIKG